MVEISPPYLLYLGDAHDHLAAKTAIGIAYWRPDWCLGQMRLPACQATLTLPEMNPAEAAAKGARTMVVGVVNQGGYISDSWTDAIVQALDAGLDVASGLHDRLDARPEIAAAAKRNGRRLIEVRSAAREYGTGTGRKRAGRRLLTVGTDCSVGKMYTSLALTQALAERGVNATFRATGQTGIFIAGGGVCIDAVISDFIAGATEWLTPGNDPNHWDIVEGQGSLFHPAYAGVSLGLLHGAQPDALILCHEPTRTHMRALTHQPLPELRRCAEANLQAARLTNPAVRLIGVSVDTSRIERAAAAKLLGEIEAELGVPAVDPVATGIGPIADTLKAWA